MIVETRAGTAWHASRTVSDGGALVDIRGVSNDGTALGFVSPPNALEGWQLAWLDVLGMQLVAPPSADCIVLLPASLTTGRRAVAVADFGDERMSRAVLIVNGHARFLDELADGEFPWASSIRQGGTVVAAVMRPEGRLGICQLIDTGIDGNVDGKATLEDLPVFLERFAVSSDLCDINLSGTVEGSDFFQWIDVVADSQPSGLGARALELMWGASRLVSASAFPSAVANAAAAQISFLGESEFQHGFVESHTPECVEFVVSASSACGVVWDAACDALANDYYAQVAAAGGRLLPGCIEAVCEIDPFCCSAWDGHCEALVRVVCPLPPGQGCPFTQPWPYDESNPAKWSYCGAAGGTSFESLCFNHCCADHDMCYSTCSAYGADPSETNPFDACNERFLDCMLASCIANSNPSDPMHSWCGTSKSCKGRALAYYLAVKWFSDTAWCACCAAVTPEQCGLPLPIPNPVPDGEGGEPGWWRFVKPLVPFLIPGPLPIYPTQ